MRSIHRSRSLLTAAALLTTAAVGCDRQDAPSAPDPGTPLTRHADGRAATVYTAKLRPLNGHVSFAPVTGQAVVTVREGVMTVRINARGAEPGIPHPQHIHGFVPTAAGSCPGPDADVNGDGVIDVLEGLPDYGGILVTLDGDLSDGAGTDVATLPNPSNRGGAFQYTASALLADVTEGAGAALDLGSRHIVVHGVNPDTPLDDAASVGGLPAWLTLPIACGELVLSG